MAEALAGVRQMPQYRADSIEIRGQLEQKIADVHNEVNIKFDDVTKKFDAVMTEIAGIKCNMLGKPPVYGVGTSCNAIYAPTPYVGTGCCNGVV